MQTLKGEIATFETLKDLKPLLSSPGPCISLYMPLSTASTAGVNPNAKQNELHWREMLRSLDPLAGQYGAKGRELLESIGNWDAVAQNQDPQSRSVAVFRSPETFQVTWLDSETKDRATIGPHFYIRPLLANLTRNRSFYLLALSQKDVRLLHCTSRSAEEVALPAATQTNFDEWMNQVKPDHNDVYNSTTGPSSGASKGAIAPMGSDRETKDEYLAHFFGQIDRGINETLRGHTEPLVVCAVESQLALYRAINSYEHLAREGVHGAPNGLKSGEMHARAIEALEKCYEREVDDALAEWNHKVGGGASSRLKEVITAAHEGRVLTLLVSDSLQTTGSFDENTYKVTGRETGKADDEDLVNDAAVQAVLHAGKVFVVPHHKMPNGAAVAAIFRFAEKRPSRSGASAG